MNEYYSAMLLPGDEQHPPAQDYIERMKPLLTYSMLKADIVDVGYEGPMWELTPTEDDPDRHSWVLYAWGERDKDG